MATYKPTSGMASAAKRAKKMRDSQPPSNRGMTSTGLARMNQLINREPLSLDTVKRMYSFFSRHEVDKSSSSWKKGNSKAEQAWLGWGGDAGYSWSKSIVEREEKKESKASNSLETNVIREEEGKWVIYSEQGKKLGEYDSESDAEERLKQIEMFKHMKGNSMIRVNMLTQVNANHIRIDRVMENNQPVVYIRNHKWLIDNAVLNNGLYSTKENQASYKTMDGTLFTYDHPSVDGKFVAISNQSTQDANKALEKHYMYASNQNPRYENGAYYKDIRINVNNAKNTEGGKKLLEWVDNAEKFHKGHGDAPECLHSSTGLMCNKRKIEGNSRGKNYTWTAEGIIFDHDALVKNGAGGDEISLAVNGEGSDCDVITVNLEDAEKAKDEMMFLPSDDAPEEEKVSWLAKVVNQMQVSVKSLMPALSTNEESEMALSKKTKEIMLNALTKAGEKADAWTDEQICDRYAALNEDDEEDDDDEEDENGKEKGKEMKGNSFTLEDVQNLLKEERKSILSEIQTNNEKSERETIVNAMIANAAASEDEREDLMSTPLNVLRKMSAKGSVAPIASAFSTNAKEDTTGLMGMKMEGAE